VNPRVGQLVTPNIRLLEKLGAGGMGSVWRADHLALSTQVVVKFMATELLIHSEVVGRFRREAAAAAQVKSPHVVQMLDHGVTPEGILFIVMELLTGHDLGKEIDEKGGLQVGAVARIITQVAKALSKAHEQNIVHRDIKPDNIFLCHDDDGEPFVKLLDFGIAKSSPQGSQHSGTQTGLMIGTPHYMSPEQLRGDKSLDYRSDLWSLGVVVYEALTGQRPFRGDSVAEIAVAVHTRDLMAPSAVRADLPPSMDLWFERACAQNPADRFASARELADALTRCLAEPPQTGAHLETRPLEQPLTRALLRGEDNPGIASTLPMDASHPSHPASPPTTDAGVGHTQIPLHSSGAGRGALYALVGLGVVGLGFGVHFATRSNGAPSASGSSVVVTSASPSVSQVPSLVQLEAGAPETSATAGGAPLSIQSAPIHAKTQPAGGHPKDSAKGASAPSVPTAVAPPPVVPAPVPSASTGPKKYQDIH
jgi:serine/threonine protein kinase